MFIGKIELDAPLALAPMAGITDQPFRVIARRLGAGLTVSEMVSAKGLLFKNVKTTNMLRIADAERPTAIQLFGSVPEELAEAARIAEEAGADIIDFNMGCPVHKIVNNGEGSALMLQPELAGKILAAMVRAVRIPVTIKCRSGWDSEHINACAIAKIAEACGVAAVSVHARTRQQFYSGQADWSIIKQVKDAVKIPVFGNGDITCAEDGLRMLNATGCDGLMIGRGADGYPWIFSELKAVLTGAHKPAPPAIGTRLDLALEHLDMLIDYQGEYSSVREMRQHMAAYLKGLPHAAEFRARFHKATTRSEFLQLLEEYRACAKKYYEQQEQYYSNSENKT